jgi:hypothetical protein
MIAIVPRTSDFLDPARTRIAEVHVVDDYKDIYHFILIHAVHQGMYLGFARAECNNGLFTHGKHGSLLRLTKNCSVRVYDPVRGYVKRSTSADIITDVTVCARFEKFKRVRPGILEQQPESVIAEYLSIGDSVYLNHMVRELPATRYMRVPVSSMSVDPYIRVLDLDTGDIEIQRSHYGFANVHVPANCDIMQMERRGQLTRIDSKCGCGMIEDVIMKSIEDVCAETHEVVLAICDEYLYRVISNIVFDYIF